MWLFSTVDALSIEGQQSLIDKARQLKLCSRLFDLIRFDDLSTLSKFLEVKVCQLLTKVIDGFGDLFTFVQVKENQACFLKFSKHLSKLLLNICNVQSDGQIKSEVPEIQAVVSLAPTSTQRLELFTKYFYHVAISEQGENG